MKYTVTYTIKISARKEITQTAYCLGEQTLKKLLRTIKKMGYTLNTVTCEEL